MGLRFIFLIVAIVAVWFILRHLFQNRNKNLQKKPPPPLEESIVACKTCGLHLPENSAIKEGEDYFCCQEHLEQQ